MLTGVTLLMFLNQADAREAFIEMPSPCYSVETIKNEKVYLKEDEKACEQVVSKALIQIDDGIQKVEVYVKGKLWNVQELNKQDVDLEKIAAAAKEQKIDMAALENKNEDAAKRADEAAKQFYSEKYQNKLNKEMERIKTETFKMGDKENTHLPETAIFIFLYRPQCRKRQSERMSRIQHYLKNIIYLLRSGECWEIHPR
jgi:hypothetical protein